MKRLAIITTHPIQYIAPLFRLLNERGKIHVKVFYTWGQTISGAKYDPGFGKQVDWDIPLLEGYEYSFAENISRDPGTHHFKGIINPGLIPEIEAWEPNAILVFGWSFKSHFKCLQHFHKKIPVWFRGDSTLMNEKPGLKKMLRRIFLKWVYRHVDAAFYVGSQNKSYYAKHGLREDQLFFAPHAIDNDRFFDMQGQYEEKAIAWRRKLNIRDEDIVFLFAGKLEPIKNIELLISSFLMIRSALTGGSKTQLVIVGNGLLETELKERYGRLPNIHFVGFQNQSLMPVVYRLGNVFVLPSTNETWGLSINEAMACGRAVLVSDKCGAAIDLVRNNENGFIFESGNSSGLLEKMNYLSGNRSTLLQMGQCSGSMIESWNLEQVAAVIENKTNEPIQ
jgi:glycosyltransferase involved in cell wall biosynthesis